MPVLSAYVAKMFMIWLVAITVVVVGVEQVREYLYPAQLPQIVETIKPVDAKQLECLATNIYYEARNEPTLGQAAVARVVLNRVRYGFASTPCRVIYQTSLITKIDEDTLQEYSVKICQFSWVCEQKGPPNTHDPKYQQAQRVAYDILAKDAYKDAVPSNILFFHNLSVDPLWPYKQVIKIGNHIFYSKTKTKVPKHVDRDA